MAYVVDKSIIGKPSEKYWITYIKQRIRKNKNFLGFISGQTGSGKSYSTLRICEELDPDFTIGRVVFGGLELMSLINSGELKKGSAIAFEEVGVEMSNRSWQSVTNKMLNYLLQTFRHKNIVLIMNSPYMDFVDVSTRKLFHAEMSTQGINHKKKEVRLKPQLIQYNSRLQKFYFKRLKVITPQGKMPVDVWNVGLPSEALRLAYEQKKAEYTANLNKRIQAELEQIDRKQVKVQELTQVQEDTLQLLKKGMSVEGIAKLRNKHLRTIYHAITLLKKKGYVFKAVRNPSKGTSYRITKPSKNP